MTRKASIKESGEELSQADWERFDAAVAAIRTERPRDAATGGRDIDSKDAGLDPPVGEHNADRP